MCQERAGKVPSLIFSQGVDGLSIKCIINLFFGIAFSSCVHCKWLPAMCRKLEEKDSEMLHLQTKLENLEMALKDKDVQV